MVRILIISTALLFGQAQNSPASAQKGKQNKAAKSKSAVKFLENIIVSLTPGSSREASEAAATSLPEETGRESATTAVAVEHASRLQLKYALLLNTQVERIQNLPLFSLIDAWYGTPYQMGGSSREGIDCSAFAQLLFSSCYSKQLPRTAREQYAYAVPVAQSEFREGDLLFFNTHGGVSHVGVYLMNNKFVHAATSSGVTISDLVDPYWSKKFIGGGRFGSHATDTIAVVKP